MPHLAGVPTARRTPAVMLRGSVMSREVARAMARGSGLLPGRTGAAWHKHQARAIRYGSAGRSPASGRTRVPGRGLTRPGTPRDGWNRRPRLAREVQRLVLLFEVD